MEEEKPKKYSPLAKRDPERDVIVKKKIGRPKKGPKPPYEPTDDDRENVCAWVSNGAKLATIAKLLDTSVNDVKKKFVYEIQLGKDITVARVYGKVYKQAMSDKRDALTAQSQKMIMQNVGDWKDATKNVGDSAHGGDTKQIMKGMTNTEKMQRLLKKLNEDMMPKPAEEKKDKKPKNITFN